MRAQRGGAGNAAYRLGILVLSVYAVITTACGVPLSAGALTATAVIEGTPAPALLLVSSSVDASGRAPAGFSAPVTLAATPAPAAPAPLATGTPVASVSPSPPPSASPATLTSPSDPVATPTPLLAAALAAAPAAALLSLSPTPTATAVTLPGAGDPVQALQLINDLRSRSGLQPLRSNPTLVAEATSYARLMGTRNFFGHNGLDGSSPDSRLGASGYAGRFKGEAIAAGQSTAQSVVTTWLNSPAHAAIVLDSTAVDVGIGYYYGAANAYGSYWVLVTGVQ